jgi:hypothetical protein
MSVTNYIKPAEANITFYLGVYQDIDLLDNCLSQLRQVYPESPLIIRSDGDSDPKIAVIAQKYEGECHYGKRLYPIENGGMMIQEMLRLFLIKATAYLMKIDTDTHVARQFNLLPEKSCIFGTLQQAGEGKLRSIQGGCSGFTLEAVQQLYDSRLLLDEQLTQRPPPWALNESLYKRAMINGLTTFEWTIAWACEKLGIPLVDWPEIMSEWQVTPENDDLRYAITHPHKPCLPIKGAKRCALRYYNQVDSMTELS